MIDPELFKENQRTSSTADERQYLEVGPLTCERGGTLENVTVAYETWGTLTSAKDNVAVICHALSGDAHAVGWWERMVGPGRPIDTDRFFVIGTNALGGCQGTTGPASLAPDGLPYKSRFPRITVRDMVEVQRRLIFGLGLPSVHLVAGGSMGGMMALEWTRPGPGPLTPVRNAFITASAHAHNAMQIGFNEAARQAVMRDPAWQEGEYTQGKGPDGGLAVARMIGHLSFLSQAAFEAKFGRNLQDDGTGRFQIESYLNYQGDKFTQRFDANTLLVLTRAIDDYSADSLTGSSSRYLFTSFTSDWIYPSYQSEALLQMALEAGCEAEWHDIELAYGHDAFLLDGDLQGELVRKFLG